MGRRVVLHLVLSVGARGGPGGTPRRSPHDAGQHIGPVGLVVEGRLRWRTHQQVGAVRAPAVSLWGEQEWVPVEQAACWLVLRPDATHHHAKEGPNAVLSRTRDSQPL